MEGANYAELVKYVPPGKNYLHFTPKRTGHRYSFFGWRRRYWSYLLKLDPNRPSWTLTASPGPCVGPFHWEGRRLASNEQLALQSFPTGYSLHGQYRDAVRQIGNAVPPLLGEVIARELLFTLRGIRRRGKPKTSVPKATEPLPALKLPAVPARLIEKYRKDVSPHPGEGAGPGAQSRGSDTLRTQASEPPTSNLSLSFE